MPEELSKWEAECGYNTQKRDNLMLGPALFQVSMVSWKLTFVLSWELNNYLPDFGENKKIILRIQ